MTPCPGPPAHSVQICSLPCSWPGLLGPPLLHGASLDEASDLEPNRRCSALRRARRPLLKQPARLSDCLTPPTQGLPSISKHGDPPNPCLARRGPGDPSPIQPWIYKRLSLQSSSGLEALKPPTPLSLGDPRGPWAPAPGWAHTRLRRTARPGSASVSPLGAWPGPPLDSPGRARALGCRVPAAPSWGLV